MKLTILSRWPSTAGRVRKKLHFLTSGEDEERHGDGSWSRKRYDSSPAVSLWTTLEVVGPTRAELKQ